MRSKAEQKTHNYTHVHTDKQKLFIKQKKRKTNFVTREKTYKRCILFDNICSVVHTRGIICI